MLMLLQALAQGGQRPSRDGMRRRQRAQEVRQVAGQRVKLKPDGIGTRADRALVPDIPARMADQDRRPSGATWPLRHLPDGGGGGGAAARRLRGRARPDQRPARTARRGRLRMIDTPFRSFRRDPGGGTRVPEGARLDAPGAWSSRSAASSPLASRSSERVRTGTDWKNALSHARLTGGRPYGECRLISSRC
jgi:hypothetical protein